MNSNSNLGGGTLGANAHPGALGLASAIYVNEYFSKVRSTYDFVFFSGGAVTGAGMHDRLIALTRAYPYGYSALLKDISPNSGNFKCVSFDTDPRLTVCDHFLDKADDSLKPTNPAAQRAVLESDKYRVSTGNTRLRVKPLHAMSKKSLFDGLEEDDPSIQKLILKPNVKRLVLRPKPADVDGSSNSERVQNDAVERNAGDLSSSADPTLGGPRTRSERDDSVDAHSPSSANIQKRIGLTSPRGSILKNSSNTPDVGADNSNSEDAPENRRSSW